MTIARITAIVVVHGSPAATVDACVTSLLASTDVDVFVVLVDNASPDHGAAVSSWSRHARVRLVRSERNDGFAAGVNQGLLRKRPSDLVFLLNDDATVEPTTLATCARALDEHADAIAVAPRIMLANQPELIDSIGVVLRPNGEAFNAWIGQRWDAQIADGDDVLGACFCAGLFRSDAFDDVVVGRLDERFRLYYEDIDWALRAQRLGWRTIAAPSAVVFHQHAASTRLMGEARRYELVQRNLLLSAAKDFTPTAAVKVWASRLVVHAKGVVSGPYRLERIRSIARAVAGLPGVLVARRHLPRTRARTDAELFAYAVGMSPNFDTDTYRAVAE